MTTVVSRPSSSSYIKYKRTLRAPGAAVRITTKTLQKSPEKIEKFVIKEKSSTGEKSSPDSGSKAGRSKLRRLKSRKARTYRLEIFKPSSQ